MGKPGKFVHSLLQNQYVQFSFQLVIFCYFKCYLYAYKYTDFFVFVGWER
jgi:hypothetical protein